MKRYLYKTGILLMALFGAAGSYGQKLTIDQINSDSAALRYVKEMNYDVKSAPQWKFFYLTSGDEWQSYYNFSNSEIDKYSQQTQSKRWLKTDLNSDGKTDLVVSGYIAKRPGDWATATFKILVYLSQSGKSYTAFNLLASGSDHAPAYFNEIQVAGKHYLQLHRWQSQDELNHQPYQSDTIRYSSYWGSFLNFFQKGIRHSEISSISYKVLEDFDGSYHALNIDLETTKKTNMEIVVKRSTEKEPDINRARLAKDLWVHMDTLIRSSYAMGRVKGDTTIVHHDINSEQLPIYLTVIYKDGHKETIQDYGNGANYSVITIYACMENIIQNVFDQLQRRQELINGMLDGVGSFGY
ncbi:hypothetical protein [Arachidicoccus terrestris]|uniref:hypothetical protein n=1 Tax=Arachidicoccus terrestris TaxID=2875539 RepID=UPI001CC47534|nr:hypothetical protein [Arachidicoccus terrestris]UAY54836.1 hypothetical protein K9M52_15510 [Arachidicoccus terrestris]